MGLTMVGACNAEERHPLRIAQFQQLDGECEASIDAPRRVSGVLDLEYADRYMAHARVERTDGDGGPSDLGEEVWLIGADVDATLSPGLRDGLSNPDEVDAATAWALPLAPAKIEIAEVVAMPLMTRALVDSLRRGVTVQGDRSDLGTVRIAVTLASTGTPDNDRSAPLYFDVRLCWGCLIDVLGVCPGDAADPAHPSSMSPVCVFGQDDVMPCCEDADGMLWCAPSSVPPDCRVTGCPAGFDCYDCWGDLICNDGTIVC